MGEVTEILRMASDKLAEGPHRWTTRTEARYKSGKEAPVSRGYSWCAVGIVRWAAMQKGVLPTRGSSYLYSRDVEIAEAVLKRAIHLEDVPVKITYYNDQLLDYQGVLDWFQKAVKLADERGL